MNWDYFNLMKKHEEEKKSNALKAIFITVGVVVSIAALAAVAYTVLKKYFTITIECDECDCDCDGECELTDCCDGEPCCCEAEECDAPEAAE
jgi:flagellar basal body-associated protein FliL